MHRLSVFSILTLAWDNQILTFHFFDFSKGALILVNIKLLRIRALLLSNANSLI